MLKVFVVELPMYWVTYVSEIGLQGGDRLRTVLSGLLANYEPDCIVQWIQVQGVWQGNGSH